MIITTHYSINTMATGNKVILVCPSINEKMFPFTETLSCLLPMGNSNAITNILEDVMAYHVDEIVIIGPSDAGLENISQQHQVRFLQKNDQYLDQLYDEMKLYEHTMIIHANAYLHKEDIKVAMELMSQKTCGALIQSYDAYTKSIDGFGVQAQESIQAIYAHPRAHYVNAQVCGVYVCTQEIAPYMKDAQKGFHNINCGQMPDMQYYVEEAIQNAIEDGMKFQSIWSLNPFIKLEFPWNLAQANEIMCLQLELMDEHKLSEDTKIDSSCKVNGFLETGQNVIIQDGVIFEGNCKIGNHVTIEKGAIIGKDCIIGDHSTIQYQCRISDHSVIGTNNKIGYHAEVCGVTFDGVCAVHGCEVFGIIGKKVDIAAGVRMAILRFDDSFVVQQVQGKKYSNPYTNHIFIGNYCRTGVNNVFLPGVKVGSRSAIGPSVLVEKDIEENSLVLLKQEVVTKEWGSHRYGW